MDHRGNAEMIIKQEINQQTEQICDVLLLSECLYLRIHNLPWTEEERRWRVHFQVYFQSFLISMTELIQTNMTSNNRKCVQNTIDNKANFLQEW